MKYKLRFAIPDGVAVQQIIAILAKYFEAHPAPWHFNTADLIENALTEAFPNPEFKLQKPLVPFVTLK
jgi:hypothetical protein